MFYKNKLKTKKTKDKEFCFDMLAYCQQTEKDDSAINYNTPKKIYNYITEDGSLKSGYGFKVLAMPLSIDDLENETIIPIRGDEVKALWKLKWYDEQYEHIDKYYLFYYNDENKVCYDNILDERILTITIDTTFSDIPYAMYYRQYNQDCLMLSGDSGTMLVAGFGTETSEQAPKILSCCTHYGKLFAIIEGKRGTLVYTDDTDVLNWQDEKTKDLDFSDGRGNLNKVLSYEDYLYIFRDFGITKVSIYGSDEEFSISHQYFSDSVIYPDTISQSGDNIYFLTASGLKVFNGSSVKDLEIDCQELFNCCENRNATAVCFEGKYYLACKGDFKDDAVVGCEGEGFINNMLLVYDLSSKKVDVVRGVDIHQLLALTNPYKSKLVACFNNEYIGKIGELTKDGKVFDENLTSCIAFPVSDFNKPFVKKRIKSFMIKSKSDCKVIISNEDKVFEFNVKGNKVQQKVRTDIVGKSFSVKIEASGNNVDISKFILTIGQEE